MRSARRRRRSRSPAARSGSSSQLCQQGAKAWAEQTGNQVNVISTPNSATERLALYQQILAANSADIDVYQIDVIWPGILASHFIDLAEHIPEDQIEPALSRRSSRTTRSTARLVAMPWFTDAGILYYRKDLLEKYGKQPPATWQELTETAKEIQDGERADGNDKMQGFVFQAKAYEGLTCNALEWIDSFGGGTIVAEDGSITINNEKAAQALDLAATWIGAIAPEGVLNYAEEEARGVFQSGNAVFMRNWPYAWALGNADDSAVKGKIGVAALPKGGDDGKHTRRARRLAARGLEVLAERRDRGRAGRVPDQPRGAEAARDRGLVQPDHRSALRGPGGARGRAVLRRAVRDLHQRRGAALKGHRRQVQPGELGVLQRRARRAERQGETAPTGWRIWRASWTGSRAAAAGSRLLPDRGSTKGTPSTSRRR